MRAENFMRCKNIIAFIETWLGQKIFDAVYTIRDVTEIFKHLEFHVDVGYC